MPQKTVEQIPRGLMQIGPKLILYDAGLPDGLEAVDARAALRDEVAAAIVRELHDGRRGVLDARE